MSKDYPWGKGTPTWTRDAAANDSDKSFTVPTGKRWVLRFVQASLVTTATVGNRVVRFEVGDGTNLVFTSWPSASVAASTAWNGYYTASGTPGNAVRAQLYSGAATAGVQSYDVLPDMVLLAGYTIRVYDSAAIDAAADDLTVVLHYVEYDA